ncbi:MAG: hypothetical protein KF791_02645 [Verrucomicrobiae bacterium]|nr:hypothetical protein [Verrucomicrobiae bacterium]
MKRLLSPVAPAIAGTFLASAVSLVFSAVAQSDFFRFTLEDGVARFSFETDPTVYYLLQGTFQLPAMESLAMTLGSDPVAYELAATNSHAFFRTFALSLFGPRDSDADGMDDLWELGRGLDPLDATDALLPSPNVAGLTNLEEYRLRFGLSSAKPQYYGREISLFNYGAPSAILEAISREWSVFNTGAGFEALSREVSIFNGARPPTAGYPAAYSREQSLFNFGTPLYALEALGRELTVFNGDHPPTAGYPATYSREISSFNHGVPTAFTEAISREFSVFNDLP